MTKLPQKIINKIFGNAECSCKNNACPSTCEHKQFKRSYTECYLYDTCECECNCPNDSGSYCDFCNEGRMCDSCTIKIHITRKEFSICRLKCLQRIIHSTLDDYPGVCDVCWKDEVICYSTLDDISICKECYDTILRSSL